MNRHRGSQYSFVDFMGLGAQYCDASERDPAQLRHHDRDSTFCDGHLGVHHLDPHLEDGDRTLDLFPAGNVEHGRGVCRLEDGSVTTDPDDSQLDLELRLGVLQPESPVPRSESPILRSEVEGCHNMTMHTMTDGPWAELVRQAQSPHLIVPTLETQGIACGHGVSYFSARKKWRANVYDSTNQLGQKYNTIDLGYYNTADEAIRIHDMVAIKLDVHRIGGTLNFPESKYADYMEEHSDWSIRDFIWKLRREFSTFTKGSSSMKAVYTGTPSGGSSNIPKMTYSTRVNWTDSNKKRSQIWHRGFTTEEEAGRFYDAAMLALKSNRAMTNFRPSSYSTTEIEEARQWLVMKCHPNFSAPTSM